LQRAFHPERTVRAAPSRGRRSGRKQDSTLHRGGLRTLGARGWPLRGDPVRTGNPRLAPGNRART